MNISRDFSSSAILAAEIEKFELAKSLTRENSFVNVNYADEYYFSPAISGLDALTETHNKVGENFTVFDVGYGNGSFLREVSHVYPNSHRIGIAAVYCGESIDSTLISGDIARVDTWVTVAGQIPKTRSVDIAVSHLTFTNIANPINGLANVLKLMKPDGVLHIDHIRLRTDSRDVDAVENALQEALVGHVEDLRIGTSEKRQIGQVSLNFPVFTDGLDSISFESLKPYVNELGVICYTV